MKLRYSEAFYSVQGEGKFVGVPSVFLRTFGCNFRCMNFGTNETRDRWQQHADGQRYNPEVKALLDAGVHKTTEKFEDLPIIHTGCDTYASIYPEFKHFNKQATVDEVVEHLLSLTPNGKWTQDNGQDIHLIMTGGEPLLAWQKLYINLFEHPKMQDLKNVTFETNTTQPLYDDFFNYLTDNDRIQVYLELFQNLVFWRIWKDAIKPMLLMSTAVLTVVTFILSLLSLLKMILKKLLRLWKSIVKPGLIAQYILCRLEDVSKNITSMLKKSPKHVWSEVGGSHQDLHILIRNAWGIKIDMPKRHYKNEQHEKAMKAEVKKEDPSDAIRKAGW